MLQEILKKHADSYVSKVAEGFDKHKMNATGKTLASVREHMRVDGFTVTGASHILAVEYGRGATRNGNSGGRSLVDQIKDWIEAKNLNLNPYAVAKSIHVKGAALYRGEDSRFPNKKQSGVLSEPVKQVTPELRADLVELYKIGFTDKIKSAFKK